MAIEGLITVRSGFLHGETLARFEAAVRANGLRIVKGVDHAIGAFEAGVQVDAMTLVMVGDGRRLAELVRALPVIGFELPFKVLVRQDAVGTSVSYVDFRWLAKRCEAGPEEARALGDFAVTIDGIVRKAVSPP